MKMSDAFELPLVINSEGLIKEASGSDAIDDPAMLNNQSSAVVHAVNCHDQLSSRVEVLSRENKKLSELIAELKTEREELQSKNNRLEASLSSAVCLWGKRAAKGNIIQSRDGKRIRSYSSLKEASIISGVAQSGISSCIAGRIKTAGGFEWSRPKERKGIREKKD